MDSEKLLIPDESRMACLGSGLSEICSRTFQIYLKGSLGAGKTTFARGFLKGLGYDGAVKSPTYTLVESYQVRDKKVFHLDLYRLSDPEELEYLGLRDMLAEEAILLVEWPERGQGMLPEPDLAIDIQYVPDGRLVELKACTTQGEQILSRINLETPGV